MSHTGFSVRFPAILSAIFLMAAATFAQSFWEKKPYTAWTEKECRKLLEDSPWAKSVVYARPVLQQIGSSSGGTGDRAWEPQPRFSYFVQMRSALPVRQAMVRLQQIAARYDKMDPATRASLDARAAEFLGVKFTDHIVFYFEYSTNVPGWMAELDNYWRVKSLSEIQNKIRLQAPRGQTILPQSYSTGAGAFQVSFPRLVNGEPVFGPNDREFSLEFTSTDLFLRSNTAEARAVTTPYPETRTVLTFRIAPMLLDGKLVY